MDQDTSPSDSPTEVNFDGLRNAISPINLMFDGKLYKDVKGLTAHITQAMKKVSRERPDYPGALIEINLLESAFSSAITLWEQKLMGEIQRLKSSVETAQQNSLGAAKKISKFKEELTRGKASTRTVPVRIGQVRNQLIHAIGNSPHSPSYESARKTTSRLVEEANVFPILYKNAARQVLRKVSQRGREKFIETALSIFKNVSKPMVEVNKEQELYRSRLYYVQQAVADDDPASHFVIVCGINEKSDAYMLRSIFSDSEATIEIEFEDFHQRNVFAFEPLDDREIVLQLLKAKFNAGDFKDTFNLYTAIRQRALENNREAKFNPKQQEIHQYLRELIFGFVGISFDNLASEVRFIEEINIAVQTR